MFAKKHACVFAAAAALAFTVLAGQSAHAAGFPAPANPSGNWGGSYKNSEAGSKEFYHSHIIINGSTGDWDDYKIENLAALRNPDGTLAGWSWEHFKDGKVYECTMWGRGTQDGNPAVYVEYVVHSGSKLGPVMYSGGGYFELNGAGDPPGDVLGVPMDGQ